MILVPAACHGRAAEIPSAFSVNLGASGSLDGAGPGS